MQAVATMADEGRGRRRVSSDALYRRRGTTALLLSMLEAEDMTATVVARRDGSHVTYVQTHPVLVARIDFAPILDAFRALSPGERIVWLAIACGIARVSVGRWEQRTYPNGKVRRYNEDEVSRHYHMGARTVYVAWMHADNVMARAFRDVDRQMVGEEDE